MKRRTWSEEEAEVEKVRRERRVEADTLGNLYNYPQGRPEAVGGRWRERALGVVECREGGGTHIDPGNHPAPRAPSSSLRATATPVHHLALAPPSALWSSLPPNRPLFHGQLSACLQCSLRRVFMSSLTLKPPTLPKFDAPRLNSLSVSGLTIKSTYDIARRGDNSLYPETYPARIRIRIAISKLDFQFVSKDLISS